MLGESIRVLSELPALALNYSASDADSRESLERCLTQGGALCLRLVLSTRSLPPPTPAEALQLIDQSGISGMPLSRWVEKDPLWGRVANVVFHAGETAHVTHDAEADYIGSLGTLAACIEFLSALGNEILSP